jgi:phosphodiesterase/alkaline phosphatase D-like protein
MFLATLLLVCVVASPLRVEDRSDVAGSCTDEATYVVAFGSCLHQEKPAPALRAAAKSKPDLFVFLGDNLYNDCDIFDMICE